MIETHVRMITFQWHVLRGAITALRNGEEGMTTLEVLVIAGGLIIVAGFGVSAISGAVSKHTAPLAVTPSITPAP